MSGREKQPLGCYTVDRLEGEQAVLEGPAGEMRGLPLSLLPPGVREGDLLEYTERGWCQRPDLRARRLAQNRALLDKLKRRGRTAEKNPPPKDD